MSDRSKEYWCHYCSFKTMTSGRLSSHFSRSPTCLNKIVAANQPSSNIHKQHHSPTPGGSGCLDDQPHNDHLYSSFLMGQPSAKQAHIEVEDVPYKMDMIFQEFMPPAGESQPKPPNMLSNFEHLLVDQQTSRSKPWALFSTEDWDYA